MLGSNDGCASGSSAIFSGGIETTNLTGLDRKASSFRPALPATIDHDQPNDENICDISVLYVGVYIIANLAAFTSACHWLTAVLRGACNPNKSLPACRIAPSG